MTSRRRLLAIGTAGLVFGGLSRSAIAATPEVFGTGGHAIRGYDPVAYFDAGKAVEGSEKHALMWMGTTWRFSKAANMAAFEMNPHRYAPQYGGYCAYAMSQGAIATSMPQAWTIHENKLYLNFSLGVHGIWRKDIAGHVGAADQFWPEILNA